ncbi:hypothetical protein GCM10022381_32470 [Leifsonia kafniensis]|uniref:TIGR02678 family protein n=1 Tax=Leifsonia kafniensis TaxID=475957 RepID=A0ABP7KYB2_9MICO
MSTSGVDDTQRAARALLRHPLIRSTDEERFRLVKRHQAELREWFEINTGWGLHVDSEVARLAREPATLDVSTHPFVARTGKVPFARRRYVLLMLCLAVLERGDAQIALGRLAELVVVTATNPELARSGFAFSLQTRDERSDLVAAVQLLLDWGVLVRVAGDETEFVQHAGDALYDVSRRVLSQLLVTRRGPSTVGASTFDERLRALRDRGIAPSDELRNLQLRHSLTRRLLDDPVVYFADLDDDEAGYLRGQRSAICKRITELTGLVAEYRAEGLAMVDLDDELTDLRMPEKGTDGHVALLLAEYLAGAGAPEHDVTGHDVPGHHAFEHDFPEHDAFVHDVDDLRAHIRSIAPSFTSYWRKGAVDDGADAALVRTALAKLAGLHLIELRGDRVRVLPALARFTVTEPTILGGPRS